MVVIQLLQLVVLVMTEVAVLVLDASPAAGPRRSYFPYIFFAIPNYAPSPPKLHPKLPQALEPKPDSPRSKTLNTSDCLNVPEAEAQGLSNCTNLPVS